MFWFNHRHPNVLPFLGVVETRSAFFLVSPYFDFGTLADYLKTSPAVDRRLLVSMSPWSLVQGPLRRLKGLNRSAILLVAWITSTAITLSMPT